MDPLFPPLPEDIAALSDAEINALIDERLAIVKAVSDRDEATLKDRDTTSVVKELTEGVNSIKMLRAELQQREQIEQEADAAIAALAEEAAGAEPVAEEEEPAAEPEKEPVAEEPEAEKEPEAIAAAGRPIRTRRVEPQPEKREPARNTLVASAGIDGFGEGQRIESRRELAEALIAKRNSMMSTPEGVEEKVRVARMTYEFPADRTLVVGDLEGNSQKIASVVGPDAVGTHIETGEPALVASGGLCAPVTPYYDLELVATTARPVRDSLPVFNAQRGGIRFAAPPTLSAVTTGAGYLTAAQDQTGGTTGAKSCQQVSCPSFSEVDVAMIYQCLRFGNLGSRAWPEQVTQFEGLTAAAAARLAERKLLDGIQAASILTTGIQFGGVTATILGQILAAASGMRSRHRMDENAVLRLLLPAWADEAIVADLARSQFGRFDLSVDQVADLFRKNHIAPTYYIDGTTTGSQVFATQGAGALLSFPATMQWFLFPEGSFLYLDAGTLDVGIVRDSTLNLTNDFQIFSEIFENIAFVGVESIQCISTICANGQVIAPIVAPACGP